MPHETLPGFHQDPHHGKQHQQRFGERGKVFHLAVAVGVGFVGWPVRDRDGDQNEQGGQQIEAGVRSLGQHAEAAAHQAGP